MCQEEERRDSVGNKGARKRRRRTFGKASEGMSSTDKQLLIDRYMCVYYIRIILYILFYMYIYREISQ